MSLVSLHDKEVIRSFLDQDPFLHLYSLGDLDDMLWPFTTWYGYEVHGKLKSIILIYAGPQMPTVLALCNNGAILRQHLAAVKYLLPSRFYAHLSPHMEDEFKEGYILGEGFAHYKMALKDEKKISSVDSSRAFLLEEGDIPQLQDLYDQCYPGNWFDPYMIQTNQYFGIKDEDTLVAAAGVHVFSSKYRAAALGNIITRTEYRNRGLGTAVTAALCKSLLAHDVRIGLNVKADNLGAVTCYEKLGFEVCAHYWEYTMQCSSTR